MLLYIVLFVTSAFAQIPDDPICVFDTVANSPYAPLLVDSNLTFPDPFALNDRRIKFNRGDSLYLACPGGQFNYPSLNSSGELVTCYMASIVLSNSTGERINFANLTCTLDSQTRPWISELHSKRFCEVENELFDVGYRLGDQFTKVLSICFNGTTLAPFYSVYTTNEWSQYLENYTTFVNNKYNTTVFDYVDVSAVFEIMNQRILDLGININDTFLEKGYLASTDDFFSAFQRDATADFANVVPIWQQVNQGSWKNIEKVLKNYIQESRLKKVKIIAGTLEVLSLKNIDLYLHHDRFPVPKWLFKIYYSPKDSSGGIYVVHNNPFANQTQTDEEFITTICKEDQSTGSNDPYFCSLNVDSIIHPDLRGIVSNILYEQKWI